MVRNTGSELSKGPEKVDSCVYSISGLSITGAIKHAKSVFADHQEGDTAVLQVGTSDLLDCQLLGLSNTLNLCLLTTKKATPQSSKWGQAIFWIVNYWGYQTH